MKPKPKILIGCDPELFVTLGGTPKSAHGLIPGTKKEPFKVEKGAIQVDGMALEFNIDPAKNEEEFVTNIQTVMRELRAKVDSKFKFLVEPFVKFNGTHFNAQPDEAKELGCEPDFNAYTMQENPAPDTRGRKFLRTASGHIHIGLEKDADPKSEAHRIKYATLAKHLDLFLGLRSLEWDKDRTRANLYGKAGAIRFKPYGVEYRVLSNKWLDREELVRFVYKQTIACINDLMKNGKLSDAEYNYIAYDVNLGRRFYTSGINTRYYFQKKGQDALIEANKLKIGE